MKEYINDKWYILIYYIEIYYKQIKYFFIRTYYKWFKKDKIMQMVLSDKPELGEVFRTGGFDRPLLTYIGKYTYIIGKVTKL
jgi:hypothetical protein